MNNNWKRRYHSELPLEEGRANLFLEIMTAVMVFLFSVTLAGYMVINSMTKSWQNGISGSLTVQIMPAAESLTEQEKSLRLNKVITFFENYPQVEKVVLMSQKQKERLISPWLGNEIDVETLPVPELLDVTLKDESNFDYDKAASALQELAPYASIDNHNVWLHRLLDLVAVIQKLALSVLIMVLAASVFSIFYAACTSLGIHREIIEILHIMGAKDDYIAKQYARRGFRIGLLSGGVGTLLTLAAFGWLHHAAMYLDGGVLAAAAMPAVGWVWIVLLPVGAAVLSMLTSYWAVIRTLRKIL